MSKQMTDKRLAEIQTRADAATNGPWWISDYGFVCAHTDYEICPFNQPRDAMFISAARTDIPDLLAEVRRLTAERQDGSRQGRRDVAQRRRVWATGWVDYIKNQ